MITNNLKKILPATIVVFGLYSVFRSNLYQNTENSKSINYKKIWNTQTLAIHDKMPGYNYGKKLPFHQVYESRQVGLPKDLKQSKKFNTTKVILLWTPWNGLWETINYYFLQPGKQSFVKYNCPNTNCKVTLKRKNLQKADAVLFHLPDIKSSDLPKNRKSEQVWILYNMEAPWLIKKWIYPELLHLKNVFNLTMTYRSDSDITANYGFITATENSNFLSFQEKTKNIVWFVSDCATDSKREDYVKELSKYIDVDVYGTCGDHKCYPSQSSTCYEKVLDKYKFYLSFENAICKDYVTEKFFNIFNYDIIPVVFGAANYSSRVPDGTYIDATKYSDPKLLANVLLKISNNSEMYYKMLLKKRSFRAYLDPWMCRLCDVLNSDTKHKSLSNVEEWWIKEAECKTWDKKKLMFVNTE